MLRLHTRSEPVRRVFNRLAGFYRRNGYHQLIDKPDVVIIYLDEAMGSGLHPV